MMSGHAPRGGGLLGKTVADRVTGFTGIVTGRVEYITGCDQCLVTPKVKEDGSSIEAHWFDQQRLLVLDGEPVLQLDNGATPGPDKEAPKR